MCDNSYDKKTIDNCSISRHPQILRSLHSWRTLPGANEQEWMDCSLLVQNESVLCSTNKPGQHLLLGVLLNQAALRGHVLVLSVRTWFLSVFFSSLLLSQSLFLSETFSFHPIIS